MKAILLRATAIEGLVGFTTQDLESMSSDELTYLYDQYVSVCKIIDVDFEALSPDEVKQIVMNVKKKITSEKELFTWQLAAIGKFFLTNIVPNLPEDNEPGS